VLCILAACCKFNQYYVLQCKIELYYTQELCDVHPSNFDTVVGVYNLLVGVYMNLDLRLQTH
jgi:hypothetical protein